MQWILYCTILTPLRDIFTQLQVVLLENSPRGFMENQKQTPEKMFTGNSARSKWIKVRDV